MLGVVMLFYDSTIKLLDAYQAHLGGTPPPNYNGDLLSEVRERLGMLSILYGKVCEFNDEANSHAQSGFPPSSEFFEQMQGEIKVKRVPTKEEIDGMQKHFIRNQQIVLEMKMYAEAFYYFAARIRKIIIDKKEPLPLLKNFESQGVRNVRNLLIEHPGDLLIPSCGYGGGEGIKLKIAHYPGQKMLKKIGDFL
jgi:hypothetical protein